MIFVTVGTNEARFDRLLEAVDRLPGGEELTVQYGSSSLRPTGTTLVDFLSFDRLVAEVRRARVVVTHAGVGSVMVALMNGRRPIVMPRLERHGEAVDDHQQAFARRFERAGLVTVVDDADELRTAVAGACDHVEREIGEGGPLADELREYLAAAIATSR